MSVSTIAIMIMVSLCSFVFVIANVKSSKKRNALKNQGELNENTPVVFVIRNEELALDFADKANHFLGISKLLHGILLLAFLFFPIDTSESFLFGFFLEFNFSEGGFILAVTILIWGLLDIASAINHLFFAELLPHHDFVGLSQFFDREHSLSNPIFAAVFASVTFSTFWLLSAFMLNLTNEDYFLIPYLVFVGVFAIFRIVKNIISIGSFENSKEEYSIERTSDFTDLPDTHTNKPTAFFSIGAFLSLAFIVFIIIFKIVA